MMNELVSVRWRIWKEVVAPIFSYRIFHLIITIIHSHAFG